MRGTCFKLGGTDFKYELVGTFMWQWIQIFDELGVSLALSGNNHIYVSTNALYNGRHVNGSKAAGRGTVYIQTPPSDNERGVEYDLNNNLIYNKDIIKYRWSEGAKTVGALHMHTTRHKMVITLLDRYSNVLDTVIVYPKK